MKVPRTAYRVPYLRRRRLIPGSRFLIPALGACYLLLAACHLPLAAQDLGSEEQRATGKAVYDAKCAQCHGVTGAGDGPSAPYFRPAPRDFTSGIFKFRTTASGELPTDADLVRSIREGMPYTGMPPWPNLSDREVQNLVYYIKTFNDDFAGPYGNPQPVEFTEPVPASDESIARGRTVFEENQCIDCHGEKGRGDGPSAPTLEDNWGAHIRAADLTKRWTFRGGATREDIYRTFTTGLDGSPMPSYSIDPPEDQWHLVNYVYSLSEDEPDYATVVIAAGLDGNIDLSAGRALFENAEPAQFPVVGQVIEPGRSYYPAVNAIEVRAVYNPEHIAVELSWHDMRAETSGSNGPAMPAPDSLETPFDTTTAYSDAVAIQFPTELPEGPARPYFLFGDPERTVDLWFADLGSGEAQTYLGRGTADLTPVEDGLEVVSSYEDGQWVVIFKRDLTVDERAPFAAESFVPVAFNVWDGFYKERGDKRGITSWYHVYLSPLEVESPAAPMAAWGFGTLLLGLGIVFLVRRKHGERA